MPSTRAGETFSAAGQHDDVLFAVGDAEIALGVHRADVAGVQPAAAQRRRRRVRLAPVAVHDQLAAHQDFPVLGDAHRDVGQRLADRVDADRIRRVGADHRTRLGLAVALHEGQPERQVEAPDLRLQPRAAAHHRAQPAAEARHDAAADQRVEHRVEQPVGQGRLPVEPAQPGRDGVPEQRLLPRLLPRHLGEDAARITSKTRGTAVMMVGRTAERSAARCSTPRE